MLLITLCSIYSCKKKEKEPELPPLTCEGANTFGCKANGKNIATYGSSKGYFHLFSLTHYVSFTSTPWDSIVFIKAIMMDSKKYNWEFCIHLKYRYEDFIDNYTLSNNVDFTQNYAEYIIYNDKDVQIKKYATQTNHPAYVIITYNGFNNTTNKHAVAGIFDMTLVSDSGEKIRIAEGRFDINS